jgi:hypothetical protein
MEEVMRIRTLIASSSALVAALVFALASSAAASATENAGAPAPQVNAGAFKNSAGQITAAPGSPSTPKNGQCAGAWGNSVATVVFQRAKTGGLAWAFKLTRVAIEKLGPVVEVTMPTATLNNKAINPPYSPHTQSSTYNFHSSLYYYQYIGSGAKHVIKTGNTILLYWVIFGSTGEGAYRYVRCTIPQPGAH